MKRNASKRGCWRFGRSRHQPTNQSFGVCKVNLGTLKVANISHGVNLESVKSPGKVRFLNGFAYVLLFTAFFSVDYFHEEKLED